MCAASILSLLMVGAVSQGSLLSVNAQHEHHAKSKLTAKERMVQAKLLQLRPPQTRGGRSAAGPAPSPVPGDSATTPVATTPTADSPAANSPDAAAPGEMEDPGAAPGQIESDECVAEYNDGSCYDDGSSNYVDFHLTYSSDTGIFSGTVVTNQCNAKGNAEFDATPSCIEAEIPGEEYLSTPVAAPGLGTLGFSFFGENINGPLDGGFPEGQVCEGGTCDGGTDLATCALQLFGTCTSFEVEEEEIDDGAPVGAEEEDGGVLQEDGSIDLVNDCGGHANPLHYHEDMVCHYNAEDSSVHSAVVGVMNDGRGLYGHWEGGGELPALDACNGHFGTVPANETLGVEATCVYHYHFTEDPPYTIGCYGPVESVAECKSLYTGVDGTGPGTGEGTGCLDGFTDLELADYLDGTPMNTSVDLWCTCYNQSADAAMSCDATPPGYTRYTEEEEATDAL